MVGTTTGHVEEFRGERERPRPRLHFTAERGWINDAYGVTWDGSRYHVFYQALPGRTSWTPDCRWGHAESLDLVHWREREVALEPQAFETGCWSGTAVGDRPGPPTLLYTRVREPDLQLGVVAAARGDQEWRSWHSTERDVTIEAPAGATPVTAFRDPYVFRHDGRWVAVIGGGLLDGTGAVFQYTSDDLRHWTY